MLTFPKVNFKDYMLKAVPPGTIGGVNLSGWSGLQNTTINEQLYVINGNTAPGDEYYAPLHGRCLEISDHVLVFPFCANELFIM